MLSGWSNAKDLNKKIDALMQSAIEAETPGCNLGIMQKGEFLHKAGYGLANLELNVPLECVLFRSIVALFAWHLVLFYCLWPLPLCVRFLQLSSFSLHSAFALFYCCECFTYHSS